MKCIALPVSIGCLFAAFLLTLSGCVSNETAKLRERIGELTDSVKAKDSQLVAKQAAIDELHRQLDVARKINEDDLKKLFYPKELEIDKMTGGEDYDNKPGDDGVTVYVRPIDQHGDIIKIPGDLTIQLYDLAAPQGRNFLGEYKIPVDKIGDLWHGKFLTQHYTIKCPWLHGPPEHDEVTVRVVFVDYLTKRTVSAQATCKVKLAPR